MRNVLTIVGAVCGLCLAGYGLWCGLVDAEYAKGAFYLLASGGAFAFVSE